MRGINLFVLLLLCLMTLPGCKPKEAIIKQPTAINREYVTEKGTLRLSLSRATATVAETIEVTLEVDVPETTTVTVTPYTNDNFILLSSSSAQPRLVGEKTSRYSFVSRLQPIVPGEYSLGPFELSLVSENSESPVTISSGVEKITVTSLLAGDHAQLADILPPQKLKRPWWQYAAIAAAVITLAALLCWFLWKRRKERKNTPPPPLPPHRRAQQDIDALAAANLLQRGEIIQFYIRLSHILRTYIENRFGVKAPEQTTEEFLLEARKRLDSGHRQLLQDFLNHCDLVKFAKLQPTIGDGNNSLALCRRFIDETIPVTEEIGQ